MKYIKQLFSVLILASVFTFVGCNNDDPDNVGPTIEIINIPDNAVFEFGQNLVMNFNFTDQTGVYEYSYEIYSKDFLPKEFRITRKVYDLQGFFTEINKVHSVILPAKSATEDYDEGEYIIEVKVEKKTGTLKY